LNAQRLGSDIHFLPQASQQRITAIDIGWFSASFPQIFLDRCLNQMQVSVRDNNVDQALRVLKKKLQREGVFREMKLKQHFEKPSEKKVRQKAEAMRRARKLARKKMEREA
jgi:small subunit ribosomal protein S21